MSTFDGLVHGQSLPPSFVRAFNQSSSLLSEFPHIAIDHFRPSVRPSPPLACFLSHVHSDHLHGLESLRSPFVYCSPATRQILLRLVKYPHRINFARGIIETRQQTYKHLNKLLKTIPLETPTLIELSAGNEILVTLFDANHCVGAVMFLIQGQGKAILYTGDVRAEPWWVNSIVQNPILIPYTLGNKRLDKIYLDTTFAGTSWMHREFPTKAAGLQELLEKVSKYPPDTIFHFKAWTFGYENVWIALAAHLGTPIHLDGYRWGLYRSLGSIDGTLPQATEAAPLVGFHLGNHKRDGCLTRSPNGRLHSCERGAGCPTVDAAAAATTGDDKNNVVRIFPIVKRLPDGAEVAELGLGGGKGDLDLAHELEAPDDPSILGRLNDFLAAEMEDHALVARVMERFSAALQKGNGCLRLDAGLDVLQGETSLDGMPLQRLVDILARLAREDDDAEQQQQPPGETPAAAVGHQSEPLPRVITFPYARHASYLELCDLIKAFRPKDLYPCTVDAATWTPQVSMRQLFGHLCSADVFAHDAYMLALPEVRERLRAAAESANVDVETQRTELEGSQSHHDVHDRDHDTAMPDAAAAAAAGHEKHQSNTTSHHCAEEPHTQRHPTSPPQAPPLFNAQSTDEPSISEWAERAARQVDGFSWTAFGGLVSSRWRREEEEEEEEEEL
ncbi:putative DNA repair protein [Phyllosticta citriasiana]|uniref:putative DNA repair protein n=1 Tax=Phyllosticta citriasiana TaxID=595635 RepID=UPI0030FD7C23